MRRTLFAAIAGAFFLMQQPLDASADEKSVDELAIEGISKLMDALSLFVSTIPQYSAPEILENGDIIIRRKNKSDSEGDEPDQNKPEETAA
ncbi:hypothetical protein [Sneathiella glossodoripedis]|uniref:hypothetical protein n=1 Tax=Sneathiella glossodoripedis TaxID=418853 RepID=UPI0004713F53|nr:hypothetical protein [Sneathiella glossodoripedis]